MYTDIYIYIYKTRMTGLRYLLVVAENEKRGNLVLVKTVFYASTHLSSSDRRQAACLGTLTLLTVSGAGYLARHRWACYAYHLARLYIYIYIYICIYIYTCICIYIYMQVYVCIYMYVCVDRTYVIRYLNTIFMICFWDDHRTYKNIFHRCQSIQYRNDMHV